MEEREVYQSAVGQGCVLIWLGDVYILSCIHATLVKTVSKMHLMFYYHGPGLLPSSGC